MSQENQKTLNPYSMQAYQGKVKRNFKQEFAATTGCHGGKNWFPKNKSKKTRWHIKFDLVYSSCNVKICRTENYSFCLKKWFPISPLSEQRIISDVYVRRRANLNSRRTPFCFCRYPHFRLQHVRKLCTFSFFGMN